MFKVKLVILMVIFPVVFSIPTVGRQKAAGQLRLEISAARNCYPPLESFTATIKLLNKSRRSFYIENKPWGLSVFRFDTKGRRTDNSDPRRPPNRPSVLPLKNFIRIRPGAYVTFTRPLQFGKEGNFWLIGYYRSTVFDYNIPDRLSAHNVWLFDDPAVQSPKLDLTISTKCTE